MLPGGKYIMPSTSNIYIQIMSSNQVSLSHFSELCSKNMGFYDGVGSGKSLRTKYF